MAGDNVRPSRRPSAPLTATIADGRRGDSHNRLTTDGRTADEGQRRSGPPTDGRRPARDEDAQTATPRRPSVFTPKHQVFRPRKPPGAGVDKSTGEDGRGARCGAGSRCGRVPPTWGGRPRTRRRWDKTRNGYQPSPRGEAGEPRDRQGREGGQKTTDPERETSDPAKARGGHDTQGGDQRAACATNKAGGGRSDIGDVGRGRRQTRRRSEREADDGRSRR